MPATFNPYTEWLEIPAIDQPPDHYILLGLSRFEDNRQLISTAADRRMELIRTFQSGQRAMLSQDLLNEVAAARICLLDEDCRREYDRALSDDLKRLDLPPMPPPPELVPEDDMPMRAPDHIRRSIPKDPDELLTPTRTRQFRRQFRRHFQRWVIPSAIGAVAILALIVALLIRQFNE